jgi:hypothetical protein
MFASTNSLISRLAPASGSLFLGDPNRFVRIDVAIEGREYSFEIGEGEIGLSQASLTIDDSDLEPVKGLQSKLISDSLW